MHEARLKADVVRYGRAQGYEATRFQSAECVCGSVEFRLFSDDVEGGAGAECTSCDLTLMTGLAFYADSSDARWAYGAGACTTCGRVGVNVDWAER